MLTTKSLGWVETVLPQGGSVPITEQGASLGVGVGVGVGPDCAQYLPPVFQRLISSVPPQTIISLPVSTAV